MKTLIAVVYTLFCLQIIVCGQLCSGSLGDPVVRITFGGGANPGPRLNAASTTYSYVTSSCPNDGQYTLSSATSNCFGATWHTITDDHTVNDVSGYVMLINASFQPGDFYIDTIHGLCANTTYEFSAWVINVLKPTACNSNGIDPNLTFKIESPGGIVLATYNTNNISETNSPTWQQYGLFFQTPSATSDVVVRITNNAPGGCGNDLAIDDITFRPCGPEATATVAANGTDSVQVCENENNSFLIVSSYSAGYANPAFQWQESLDNGNTWNNVPGANSTNFLRPHNPTTGFFKYRMLIAEASNINSAQCRIASNAVTINVNSLPVIQVNDYAFGCYGANVALFAAGGAQYYWTGPNGFSSHLQAPAFPDIRFTDAGVYKVLVTATSGCSSSDSTNLVVYPVPTATVSADMSICEGSIANLSASGGIRYKWIPSLGLSNDTIANPVARPTDSTSYKVFVINEYGCSDSALLNVNLWKKPVANAGPDKKTRFDLPVQLDGSVTGTDISFFWTPSTFLTNTGSLQPTANPPQTTVYTLHSISNLGCGVSIDEVSVKVFPKVVIPNAFSPNGDGINDTWVLEPQYAFAESIIEVHNRYGQIVYRSTGNTKPWDGTRNGTPLPMGTYYYVVDFRIDDEPKIAGWVMILR